MGGVGGGGGGGGGGAVGGGGVGGRGITVIELCWIDLIRSLPFFSCLRMSSTSTYILCKFG